MCIASVISIMKGYNTGFGRFMLEPLEIMTYVLLFSTSVPTPMECPAQTLSCLSLRMVCAVKERMLNLH